MEPMEGIGGGSMSPARVKEEPPDEVTDCVIKVELEPVDEEECVKTEPSWSDSAASCGVSEAAALAGLYTDHVVKDELVLGPERPHRPDQGLLVRGAQNYIYEMTHTGEKPFECSQCYYKSRSKQDLQRHERIHRSKIIAASKSKAQKQREYRQRIAALRTPAQAAAARKSNNERQRNNRLRQAANLAIASGSLEATTTSSSRSGEESNNVQTRSQRQHAQQQSTTTADQPDERVNLTNEPLFPAILVPMEVHEAVASTSATPYAESITAAPKTRAQIQREYRQRIAASRTPAQAAAAREARNVRERNNRLRQAAYWAIARGSLEATTTSSSRSWQRY